jgi:hypothetical protein
VYNVIQKKLRKGRKDMSKIKRMRAIIESNARLMLPTEYDKALVGLYYKDDEVIPVYKYLSLIEAHMVHNNETEEQSLNYIEDNVMSNPAFIIVDDTGV